MSISSRSFLLFLYFSYVETKAPHDVLTDWELTTVDQVSTFSSTSTSIVLGLLVRTTMSTFASFFFF